MKAKVIRLDNKITYKLKRLLHYPFRSPDRILKPKGHKKRMKPKYKILKNKSILKTIRYSYAIGIKTIQCKYRYYNTLTNENTFLFIRKFHVQTRVKHFKKKYDDNVYYHYIEPKGYNKFFNNKNVPRGTFNQNRFIMKDHEETKKVNLERFEKELSSVKIKINQTAAEIEFMETEIRIKRDALFLLSGFRNSLQNCLEFGKDYAQNNTRTNE